MISFVILNKFAVEFFFGYHFVKNCYYYFKIIESYWKANRFKAYFLKLINGRLI